MHPACMASSNEGAVGPAARVGPVWGTARGGGGKGLRIKDPSLMLSEVVLVLVEVRCLGRAADVRLPLGKERALRVFDFSYRQKVGVHG